MLTAAVAFGQDDETLIQREIDRATQDPVWLLGPFSLVPGLRLGGAYDSSVVLTGDIQNPDIGAFAAPRLTAATPIGSRALIEVAEELNFVYFRELDELRDVFNVTRLGGAFGGKQAIVRVSNEFRQEKVRPTRELEIPVDQRANLLASSLAFAVGARHELDIEFSQGRYTIEDEGVTVGGVPVKSLLDRRETFAGLKWTQDVSLDTSAYVEGYFGHQSFDDKAVRRDADNYGVSAGAVFAPTGNVRGEGFFGYRRLVPDDRSRPEFAGLVGLGDVRVGFSRRFELQAIYSRAPSVSVVSSNLFVVSNVLEGHLYYYFDRENFLRPGFALVSNRDEHETGSASVDEVLVERSRSWSLSYNRYLTPSWIARVELVYQNRKLNTDTQENRVVVRFDLATTF